MADKTEGEKTMELLHDSFKEYKKLQCRLYRHGNTETVKPPGRKKLSPEHHKATYERTLQRKKDERKQKALEQGRIYSRGRPKYIEESTTGCSAITTDCSAITGLENDLRNINLVSV
jgi:hypothetical protein